MRTGQIALLAGRFEEATELVELVLKQKPKDVNVLILYGQFAAQRQDMAKALEKRLREAEALAPDRVDVHILLSQQHVEENRSDLTEKEFSRALEIAPKLLTPRLLLVRLHMAQRQEKKAAQALRQRP